MSTQAPPSVPTLPTVPATFSVASAEEFLNAMSTYVDYLDEAGNFIEARTANALIEYMVDQILPSISGSGGRFFEVNFDGSAIDHVTTNQAAFISSTYATGTSDSVKTNDAAWFRYELLGSLEFPQQVANVDFLDIDSAKYRCFELVFENVCFNDQPEVLQYNVSSDNFATTDLNPFTYRLEAVDLAGVANSQVATNTASMLPAYLVERTTTDHGLCGTHRIMGLDDTGWHKMFGSFAYFSAVTSAPVISGFCATRMSMGLRKNTYSTGPINAIRILNLNNGRSGKIHLFGLR